LVPGDFFMVILTLTNMVSFLLQPLKNVKSNLRVVRKFTWDLRKDTIISKRSTRKMKYVIFMPTHVKWKVLLKTADFFFLHSKLFLHAYLAYLKMKKLLLSNFFLLLLLTKVYYFSDLFLDCERDAEVCLQTGTTNLTF